MRETPPGVTTPPEEREGSEVTPGILVANPPQGGIRILRQIVFLQKQQENNL
jgi:hypothetical protein